MRGGLRILLVVRNATSLFLDLEKSYRNLAQAEDTTGRHA